MAAETPFSHQTRAAALSSMAAEPVDLLVIGGGITGAGIARDTALRGFRVALVDKGDFGAGTSSHSSRLIHGGIRYLEQRNFRLVFEASRERRVLLRIAPHLVRPLPFLFPVYRGARVPAWKLRAGMWLYDVLAAFRNVKSHRWLNPKQVRRAEPALKDRGLTGAALYWDAQTDDARLVLATMRSAARVGALVANYAEATSLLKPDGRVRGAVVRDVLSGETRTVRALVVVNAGGPWVDALRRMDDSAARPLLRLTKGAHVAVPRRRIGHERAITLFSAIDGRVMSANAAFPNAHLSPNDVVSVWAGLRPLLGPGDGTQTATPSQVSREHRVVESAQGLISIAGGKLTTYRVMARDVADRVAARLHELDGRPIAPRPPTDRLPLPGGEAAELEVVLEAARRTVPDATARHLVASYGSETPAILNLVDRDRGLGEAMAPGRPEIWAEVAHAVEREMALRVQDVLIRRLHLFYEYTEQGTAVAAPVAQRMKKLLGWDEVREAEELVDYFKAVERARAFRAEIGRGSRELTI